MKHTLHSIRYWISTFSPIQKTFIVFAAALLIGLPTVAMACPQETQQVASEVKKRLGLTKQERKERQEQRRNKRNSNIQQGSETAGSPTGGTASPTTPAAPAAPVPSGPNPIGSLPRITWEGGPDYWKKFPKADAANWDDPSFFPISVFLGKPSHADQLKSVGINTYMAAEHDGSPVSLMTSKGMYVMAQQDEWTIQEVGNDPKVVSWFISDECEMGLGGCGGGNEFTGLKVQQGFVSKVNAYNDGRFKHANFGNGILRTWWSPNTMNQHVQLMDSSSADKYTYTSPHVWGITADSPDWPKGVPVAISWSYGWQANQIRKFQDPNNLKPVWTFVETARPYLTEGGARTITPDQINGAVWSAIINEARGVAYFQHNNDGKCGNYSLVDCGQALKDSVRSLNAKVTRLAPVINTQSYQYNFGNGLDTMLKWHNGSAYIFAMTSEGGTGGRTFKLPTALANTNRVEVVDENRTISVNGGSFSDNFAAEYSYHIYKVTP